MTWSRYSKICPMNRFSVGRCRPSTAQSQSELNLKPSGFFQLNRRVWGAAQPLPNNLEACECFTLPPHAHPSHHHHHFTPQSRPLSVPQLVAAALAFFFVKNMNFTSKKRNNHRSEAIALHFCCHWQPRWSPTLFGAPPCASGCATVTGGVCRGK